jgi:hypothetical protein
MVNQDAYGIRNITVTDGIAVGTTPVVLGGTVRRSALVVANPTSASDVTLKFFKKGAYTAGSPPTMDADDWHYLVSSGDFSSPLGFSESIDVWAYASSPTTVNLVEEAY